MHIFCLVKGHDWRFSYNHGIPLGCSWEEWDKIKNESYPVHQCTRCGVYDSKSDATAESLRVKGRSG